MGCPTPNPDQKTQHFQRKAGGWVHQRKAGSGPIIATRSGADPTEPFPCGVQLVPGCRSFLNPLSFALVCGLYRRHFFCFVSGMHPTPSKISLLSGSICENPNGWSNFEVVYFLFFLLILRPKKAFPRKCPKMVQNGQFLTMGKIVSKMPALTHTEWAKIKKCQKNPFWGIFTVLGRLFFGFPPENHEGRSIWGEGD